MKEYVKGHAWDIAFQQGTITEKMKEKLDKYYSYFNSRIKGGRVVTYANGFFGVGVLREPETHVSKKNELWLYGVSVLRRGKGSRIVEDINAQTSLDEAEDMGDCLKVAIEKVKGGE